MKNSGTFKFDKERNDKGKTVFLSEAYFAEIEEGVFQAYKDVMLEDPKTGKKEFAGKTVPWGKPLREAKKGDPIVSVTHDQEGNMLELTPLEDAMRLAAKASKNYEIKEK